MTFKDRIKRIIPGFVLDIYHYTWALIGALIFGFPSGGLVVIGVTGTSGKSTTTDLIAKILEEGGNKVASISTIKFKVGEKVWENKYKMTMPGRFVIQKFLNQTRKAGCKYAVLEVTSQGIIQHRHRFIKFDTVVFTNLTPEHIESHGSFENYRNAKLKLFQACKKTHIMNVDDGNSKFFWETEAVRKIGFGVKSKADITAQNVRSSPDGTEFYVEGEIFKLNLIGDFNVYNALSAVAVGMSYGIDLRTCKKALQKAKGIPGRMEIVSKNPTVIVDYAHTPEQLESAYKSLNSKNLVCVLGSCGGGRDKWKRPVLGKIASQYCKKIIITNEDPYDEDPMEIISQVAQKARNADIILDRKEAISFAIHSARDEDIVVITGKGSEPWMCLSNGKKIPWSDREVAAESIKVDL